MIQVGNKVKFNGEEIEHNVVAINDGMLTLKSPTGALLLRVPEKNVNLVIRSGKSQYAFVNWWNELNWADRQSLVDKEFKEKKATSLMIEDIRRLWEKNKGETSSIKIKVDQIVRANFGHANREGMGFLESEIKSCVDNIVNYIETLVK